MRISILWTPPLDRVGSCLSALLALLIITTPTIGYAGSISAYRDANGRVIFVNEPGFESSSITASETQARVTEAPAEPAITPSTSTTPNTTDDAPSAAIRKILKIASTTSEASSTSVTQRPALGEPRWDDMARMIEWTASRHEVDPELIRAIVRVESNFNPRAVSRKGAGGLMQLIPSTARQYGVDNIFDPKANLDGGVRYIKLLMNLYSGDLKLTLAAYNAGENAVDRHNGVSPFPETRNYLKNISQNYPLNYTGQLKKKE